MKAFICTETGTFKEISGIEFLELTRTEKRFFIRFGEYMLEVSEEQYKAQKPEAEHSRYLKKEEEKVSILSLDQAIADSDVTLRDTIADKTNNTEDEVLKKIMYQELHNALSKLDPEDFLIIHGLFFCENIMTENQIGDLLNMSQQSINKRKKNIFKKIKKWL